MSTAGLAAVGGVVSPRIPEHSLLRRIASGSYGEVWLARNALGTYRAVKIVHRSNFSHHRPFEREFAGIQAFEPISRLHENLVDLLQVGRDEQQGYLYYVMELADELRDERHRGCELARGVDEASRSEPIKSAEAVALQEISYRPRTLASEITQNGRRPLNQCVHLGLSLTRALSFLHGHQLVHRDIKPSNIVFVGGVPKLADVGLVTNAGEGRSYVGTEGFIAPEGPGTPQADLYSLGIVLYQMSTGKSHQDFPEPLPNLAAEPDHKLWLEFNAIVHKACQADVRHRYKNAEEMHAELSLLEAGRSVKQHQLRQRQWVLAKRGIVSLGVAAVVFATAQRLSTLRRGDYEGLKSPIKQANDLFDLGQHYYEKKTAPSLRSAMEYFEQAVQVDTNFAKGYAWLAACQTWEYATTNRSFELLPHARETALRALSLDNHLGRAYMALAWHAWLVDWDWKAADGYFQKARASDPAISEFCDTHALFQSSLGRTNEAIVTARRALRLQPTSISARHFLASAFISARCYDEAVEQLNVVIEMEPEGTLMTYAVLADALAGAHQFEQAIEMSKKALRQTLEPAKADSQAQALLTAYRSRGEKGYWEELLSRAEPQRDPYSYGRLCARVGSDLEALDWLEKGAQQRDWKLVFGCHSIATDPAWDHLRGHPRFQAVLRQVGLQ